MTTITIIATSQATTVAMLTTSITRLPPRTAMDTVVSKRSTTTPSQTIPPMRYSLKVQNSPDSRG
ncbi:MAG: hypothetical protein AAB599_02545 [Patescibacteria group bacterium]